MADICRSSSPCPGGKQLAPGASPWQWTTGGVDWLNWGGVVRRLSLQVRPELQVLDVQARCALSGKISVEGRVRGAGAESARLAVRLLDADGGSVWEAQASPHGEADGLHFSASGSLARPRPWSPEDPEMYTLVVRVRREQGDSTASRV